ncbi:hypothetical protein ADUPG1_005672, partial [Aduncisulcus paluster]
MLDLDDVLSELSRRRRLQHLRHQRRQRAKQLLQERVVDAEQAPKRRVLSRSKRHVFETRSDGTTSEIFETNDGRVKHTIRRVYDEDGVLV